MNKKKLIKKRKSSPSNADEQMIKNRELFLFDAVTDKTMLHLIKDIKFLDCKNHKPITLWINSPGGSCTDGLALVNVIRMVKSPITTIINTEACSMGSFISCVGDVRKMTSNAFWMAHDLKGGIHGDYEAKVIYRVEYLQKLWAIMVDVYRRHTKLTEEDLEIARHGELWLSAEECLEKGIIDEIIEIR